MCAIESMTHYFSFTLANGTIKVWLIPEIHKKAFTNENMRIICLCYK